MDTGIPLIVCYTGGTCGDLLSALIDPSGAQITENGTVHHLATRVRLKKPHLFVSDADKDRYLESVSHASVSSHDTDYHVRRRHPFIGVQARGDHTALWAAERFRKLHRPHVWQEMQSRCGARNTGDYAQTIMDYGRMIADQTQTIIMLEDIISGSAVDILTQDLGLSVCEAAKELYKKWLSVQNFRTSDG